MVNLNTVTVYGKHTPKFLLNNPIGSKKKYGMVYPVGDNGLYFSKGSGKELIKNNLMQLIFTAPGERVMLPTFGLGLHKYLFENLDDIDVREIQSNIRTVLSIFMPKVTLLDLSILGEDSEFQDNSNITFFSDANGLTVRAYFAHEDLQDVIEIEGIV
jgi:phage baseplate assembly protein W